MSVYQNLKDCGKSFVMTLVLWAGYCMCHGVATIGVVRLHAMGAIYVWPLVLPSKRPYEEKQNHVGLGPKRTIS